MKHTSKMKDLLKAAAALGFTKHDFADLAVIAAQRAGTDAAELALITRALGIEAEREDCGAKTKADHLGALKQICEQLGGRLAIVTQREMSAMLDRDWPDYDGPLGLKADANFDLEHHEGFSEPENSETHGLEWGKKIIYAVRGRESVGHLIHEMGHVFADRFPPDSSKCREWNLFGWEMAVARRIGAWATWSQHNKNYSVGKKAEWGELSTKHRQDVIAERIGHAKTIGILSDAEEPRSIR